MKFAGTLVPDIYEVIKSKGGWFSDDLAMSLGADIAQRLRLSLNRHDDAPRLRLSGMGPKCPCALWHSIYHPEMAEPLPPQAMIKYSFGHVLEALAIIFAKAAGHNVVGEQDEVILDDIVGHRDCVINGAVYDVKSCSTLGFKKFENGTLWQQDDFGYLEQLDGYVLGSAQDDLVTVKDRGYILAIDKQLGHMCTYEHKIRPAHIRERIIESKRIVGLSKPPACRCGSIADGESGNFKLDVKASYSPYKFACNPGLRIFIYSGGPRYFTKVVKIPKHKGIPLLEINRYGTEVR